ncbi:hypothetical protein PMZ80_009894 [Knufia obscura]|uniref:Uncharacterized protein n=1 Tax=Knufia obscura TaxID=1635080 RepID=A0ABR0RAY3_9EURO|nr:hypothetical protein PMZ80_009894 [Knufia obscura]
MPSTILTSFSGALQASLSVLLVIFYGVIAAQFNLIDNAAAKKVSHLSVKLFLPFLLLTKLGKELTLENAVNYVPILVWAVFYNVVSMAIGWAAVKWGKLPTWVTPAITFNNTTSLPLLLIQSLESTGILKTILQDGESTSDAISRAQSYFLVCSVVSNCLTFAIGPRLLEGESESDSDDENDEEDRFKPNGQPNGNANGNRQGEDQDNGNQQQDEERPEETTSLLHDRFNSFGARTANATHDTAHNVLYMHNIHPSQVTSTTRSFFSTLWSFFNAPLIGALIGCVIGLVPALHKAFFADSNEGGIFTAWLTASLKNAGELFVSLQVIVVGVKLSSSLRKMKRGDGNAGRIPWGAAIFVFSIRYIFWTLVSIPIIYGLAKNTKTLDADGILWFSMMLMPLGPPAMSLIPMADVSGKDEKIKMAVAKLLTGMYAASPVLAFAVTAALKASQKAMDS